MKRKRTVEVHFYEWSVSRWRTSSTRSILDGMGRGVYRELLDTCYTQGSILNPEFSGHYLVALAKDCGVSLDQFTEVWEIVRHHFIADKKDPSRLTNKQADCVRREYFSYVDKQRKNGKTGGVQKRGRNTPSESTEYEAVAEGSLSQCFRKTQANGNGNGNGNTTARESKTPPSPSHSPELRSDEQRFAELWEVYPSRGRTKLIDAQRWYLEATAPDPERIHLAMLASVLPGGKWAESDSWARGFVPGISEWIRNRRWLEDPEPFDPAKHRNGATSKLELARKTLQEADLSDVETAY